MISIRLVAAANAAEDVQASSWSFGAWCGIDGVLGDKGAVVAEPFGLLDQGEVALPGGVVWFLRVLQGAAAAVNECPNSETHGAMSPGSSVAVAMRCCRESPAANAWEANAWERRPP